MEFKALEVIEMNSDGMPLAILEHDLGIGASVTFKRLLPSKVMRGTCDDPECDSEFHSKGAEGIIVFEMHCN